MADFADDASAVEELQRNAALSAHRINRDAVSAVKCEECGDKLPEARRRLAGKRIRDARCALIARVLSN